ncbi:hypothetical protein HDV00_006879 [Rhizophlyctis rosea]|nr:hypothetical protein HDV00_006879 [Rhizophlyctis rosea]
MPKVKKEFKSGGKVGFYPYSPSSSSANADEKPKKQFERHSKQKGNPHVPVDDPALRAQAQVWSKAYHNYLNQLSQHRSTTPNTKPAPPAPKQPQFRHLFPRMLAKRAITKVIKPRVPKFKDREAPLPLAVQTTAKMLSNVGLQIRCLGLSKPDESILATLFCRDCCRDPRKRSMWLAMISTDMDNWINKRSVSYDEKIMDRIFAEEAVAPVDDDPSWSYGGSKNVGSGLVKGIDPMMKKEGGGGDDDDDDEEFLGFTATERRKNKKQKQEQKEQQGGSYVKKEKVKQERM